MGIDLRNRLGPQSKSTRLSQKTEKSTDFWRGVVVSCSHSAVFGTSRHGNIWFDITWKVGNVRAKCQSHEAKKHDCMTVNFRFMRFAQFF